MPKNSSSPMPQAVASCFWSYDAGGLDIGKDREEIITQVLNYGNWEAVKWIRETYSDKELREVLKHPEKGRWFKQCLSFWLQQMEMTLAPAVYRRALMELNPLSISP